MIMSMLRLPLWMLLFLTPFSCQSPEKKDEVLRKVRYDKVYQSPGVRLRSFSGLTQSGMESTLSFRVPGTIHYLPVKIGQPVQKGDVIAKLDPTDYTLQYGETEASLMQSKAQERNAVAKYARIRDLYETRSTSRNDLDAARAESESKAAAVEAMQKKLAYARAQLGYTRLYAPQAGTISDVKVEVNENVKSGQPVVTLSSVSSLEVKVSVPETLISQVRKGDTVNVSFGPDMKRKFIGTVSEVGVTSEVGTTYAVIVELSQVPENIRSGMAAEVLFSFPVHGKRLTLFVPPSAVQGSGQKTYVYLLHPSKDGDGAAFIEKREVVIGVLGNEGLEIVSGLKPNDLIVTAGVHSLTDGQKVRMQ